MSRKRMIMVDIEAFGRGPTGAVASIGAVEFNLNGHVLPMNQFYHVNNAPSGNMDSDTIYWWLKQSPAAREAVTVRDVLTTEYDVLTSFAEYFPRNAEMWSHSSFDAVLLRAAFDRNNIRCPWHYRDIRDIRTLTSLFKMSGYSSGEVETQMVQEGVCFTRTVAHHALDDALIQATYTAWMLKRIHAALAR